ncbi:hypothetical protein BPLS_P6037 [Bathymodiolus platifrons methanotrophic gill symbiont]|uniref:hypothetical protein n=1 Tax=Bathymodiolus platifrons methanotrophic gill symbiont TaxID=113268 RepID=UPI001B616424|nr:hypothetical protein [Bathymodiolus platifrons methanotrophic gill symbiont]GFO77548.1 hypothetical protein BPLS_P6037 [Bathymodiolus platifrons methanotrophic gill symbiont]
MKLLLKVYSTTILLTSLSGCMTFSGDKLAGIESITPASSPLIEESIGDFTMHLDGGAMVTNNKAGRIINDAILGVWKKNNYISDFTYVPKQEFTGNAEYNLTLKGHQEGKSSVAMQFFSGLTLFLLPYNVNTTYDLIYELDEVGTGKKIHDACSRRYEINTVVTIFPCFPFFIYWSSQYI